MTDTARTAQELAGALAAAVAADDSDPEGHDMAAGLFGPNVSTWLRKTAALASQAAPEQLTEAEYLELAQAHVTLRNLGYTYDGKEWRCRRPAQAEQDTADFVAALLAILDGKDVGGGVCREPWQSIRMRLIALVQHRDADMRDADRWREVAERFDKATISRAQNVLDGLLLDGDSCGFLETAVDNAIAAKKVV